MAAQNQRRNYFVNPAVQGAIVGQAVVYWLLGTAVFSLVTLVYRLIPVWLSGGNFGPAEIWYVLTPMLIASAVLLPLSLLHAVRFSHRFVGPMVRLGNAAKQLAEGPAVSKIKLRDRDYWHELAANLNGVSSRLEKLDQEEPQQKPPADSGNDAAIVTPSLSTTPVASAEQFS